MLFKLNVARSGNKHVLKIVKYDEIFILFRTADKVIT